MIKLLNPGLKQQTNDTYSKDEIITLMYDDEFYYGELYQKALSQSSLKIILNEPYEYLKQLKGHKQKIGDDYIIGLLVHWGYLEPRVFYNKVFIETERVNSKEYKEALEKHGELNVFKAKFQRISESYIDTLNRWDKLSDIRKKAEIEVPAIKMFFDDIPIKGKADLVAEDRVLDLKTTRANPEDFNIYKIRSFDYDLQAFLYCQLFEKDYFTFIPICKTNNAKGLIHCGQSVIDSGEEKFYKAVEKYKKFFHNKTIEESEALLDEYYYETIVE